MEKKVFKKYNVPITDDLRQAFEFDELDIEKWLLFSISSALKSIDYSKDDKDVIAIYYEFKDVENIYFAKYCELANILEMVNDSQVKFRMKEIEDKIFIFFN